jgi:hypothetical protein
MYNNKISMHVAGERLKAVGGVEWLEEGNMQKVVVSLANFELIRRQALLPYERNHALNYCRDCPLTCLLDK